MINKILPLLLCFLLFSQAVFAQDVAENSTANTENPKLSIGLGLLDIFAGKYSVRTTFNTFSKTPVVFDLQLELPKRGGYYSRLGTGLQLNLWDKHGDDMSRKGLNHLADWDMQVYGMLMFGVEVSNIPDREFFAYQFTPALGSRFMLNISEHVKTGLEGEIRLPYSTRYAYVTSVPEFDLSLLFLF